MIYPTRRAVLALAAGAPVALALGAATPLGWLAGPAWVILVLMLFALDAAQGGSRQGLALETPIVPYFAVARGASAEFSLRFAPGRTPRRMEAALGADARLGLKRQAQTVAVDDHRVALSFDFLPTRRGAAEFHSLWLRWAGPLGLAWKQKRFALDASAPVQTDLQGVRDEAVRLFARDAQHGVKSQLQIGEGAEFQALRDFQPGMDRRAIDWKQSARHFALLAKEFRTERNHPVFMALDCGRVMSEPVGGAPRIDRAISAALLLAYACLRSGDRAGFFAFDSRPRVSTGAVAGLESFRLLQQVAGRIDYSTAETNYTLALTTLAGKLQRRSLIVVFTDFPDSTAAELMIENLGRLLKRHLVLFVVMHDDELETLVEVEPAQTEDVARSVIADALLRERDTVVARLRRMGAQIVDAPANRIGPAVVNAYLDLKRRDLL